MSYCVRIVVSNKWLPFLQAYKEDECIGVIVSKIEIRHDSVKRGYIAMLAVDKGNRRKGLGERPMQPLPQGRGPPM